MTARSDRGQPIAVDDASVRLRLALGGDGEVIEASVRELSPRSLTVAAPGSRPELWRGPTTLTAAELISAETGSQPLAELRIDHAAVEDGHVLLTLTTRNRASQAALWRVARELRRRSERAAPRPVDEPPPATLPRIPARRQFTEPARLARLEWLRARTSAQLAPLQTMRLDPGRLGSNIENLIGAVELPVGIAGPLLFRGQAASGLVYLPLATTEGALVSSATRGATAITHCGGVTTRVIHQRMTRVPLFMLQDLHAAAVFTDWVADHLAELREQVAVVSKHARLLSVEPLVMGRNLHLCFTYETGDAAGQNMTTACTWHACQWLMDEMHYLPDVRIEHFIIEGNTSGDKKVSLRSMISGRGLRVVAECLLTREVLKRWLHVDPEQLILLYLGAIGGSTQAGTVGFNLNVANIVAGVFAATGQDVACVHESSTAILTLQPDPRGIYASLVLPSLVVGTVGGGTHLPAQSALLDLMGCRGPGGVRRLGEITAGFALALDLSTAGAIASSHFAPAHDRMGRNRPVPAFSEDSLSPAFFEAAVRRARGDESLTVRAVEPLPRFTGASLLTRLAAGKLHKFAGLFPVRLHCSSRGGESTVDVLVKVKPLDEEAMLFMNSMALLCGPRVSLAWQKLRHLTPFAGTHLRELAVFEQTDPRFTACVPVVYRTFRHDAAEAYVLVLELLRDVELLDGTADAWEPDAVRRALGDIAPVHALWLGREDALRAQPWLGPVPSAQTAKGLAELWDAIAVHAAQELPNLCTEEVCTAQRAVIESAPMWWRRLEALPRTLIHNDFTPRNLCFRREAAGRRLVAFDWELATLGVPQHDLAELLAFTQHAGVSEEEVEGYLEVHRLALAEASGRDLDPASWREGYALSLLDLFVNRFGFYLMAHVFGNYPFVERAFPTLLRLIEIEHARGLLTSCLGTNQPGRRLFSGGRQPGGAQ